MFNKLQGGHSLKCILTLAIRSPSIPVTLTFDRSTPKSCHLYDIPRPFPTPTLITLWSFVYEWSCGQTNRQTDRQTWINALLPRLSLAWIIRKLIYCAHKQKFTKHCSLNQTIACSTKLKKSFWSNVNCLPTELTTRIVDVFHVK